MTEYGGARDYDHNHAARLSGGRQGLNETPPAYLLPHNSHNQGGERTDCRCFSGSKYPKKNAAHDNEEQKYCF